MKWCPHASTFGTISVGRVADLVLLDMNPLEGISHTRKVNAIVLGGKFYPLVSIRAQTLKTPRSDNEKGRSNALSVKRVMLRIET